MQRIHLVDVNKPLFNSLCIATLLVTLLIFGCSSNEVLNYKQQATFIAEPDIELDPYLSAPLAGLLTLKTNIATRISLNIRVDNDVETIEFRPYQLEHKLPVLGLRPDKQHIITIKAYGQSDTKPALERTLTINTEPLPDGFPGIELKKHVAEKTEPGITLFDIIPEGENTEFGALIVIVNEKGEVIWYQIGSRYTDVRQLDNGNLVFIEATKVVEINMLGETVFEWRAIRNPAKHAGPRVVPTRIFHHEIFPMDKGNFLSLSVESRQYDNYRTSLKDPSAPTETTNVVGDVVIEFRPDGSIRKQWSLLDMLDPYRLGYDSLNTYWDQFFLKKTRDWSHSNAVIHDKRDNSIIVTSRHQDATIKFRRKNGELRWILGPHENWNMEKFGKYLLKPVNNRKYFFPYHAHAPMIMPNGNLLIYDNGNNRAAPFEPWLPVEENFSRVVEYAIDEETMEVELVWEYGQFVDNPIYSGALGDADYLPKTGNVLITHGNIYKKSGKLSARILEVTHTTPAVEVFQLDVFDASSNPKNGWRIYRAERIRSLYPKDLLFSDKIQEEEQ